MLPNPFREPILSPEETDAEVNDRLLKQLGIDTKGIRIGKEPDGKPRPRRVSKEELLAAAKAAIEKADEEKGSPINLLENPKRYFNFATNLYKEQNLPEWIPTDDTLAKLKSLSPEKKALISRELAEGSIAILMPGRETQVQTLGKAIQNLRPLWIENGKEKEVKAPYQWYFIETLVREKRAVLFQDIPPSPYILLTKPTQEPPPNTLYKNLNEQIRAFNRIKYRHPRPCVMNIPGYIALQSWATRIEHLANRKAVSPLDRETFTRFIALPIFGVNIPHGRFDLVGARLKFDGSSVGHGLYDGGFRLEVRVGL